MPARPLGPPMAPGTIPHREWYLFTNNWQRCSQEPLSASWQCKNATTPQAGWAYGLLFVGYMRLMLFTSLTLSIKSDRNVC